MLTSEVYGSGLKDRVIACRKRVRLNRATHRVIGSTGLNGVKELFPETAASVSSVSEFNEYAAGNLPERPTISTSAVHLEHRAPFSLAEAEEGESMLLAGEQGVGIT
jgi:hypothetical protein